DQVFNVANLMAEVPGPTATLSLEYERMTPLHVELRFEAWVESIDGRKVTTVGHALHEDQVTVKARGLFIKLDPKGIEQMRRR
ncbi:unnamed protein product, partial [marine sediment metagenome]